MNDCGIGVPRIWHEWWDAAEFRLDCERIENTRNGKQVVIKWEDDIQTATQAIAQERWLSEVQRLESHTGIGNNKLRTYARFKKSLELEPYLEVVEDHKKRRLMTKFRIGLCPLRIETGRYEAAPAGSDRQRGVPPIDRICACCELGVEDECHFLVKCPRFTQMRECMMRRVRETVEWIGWGLKEDGQAVNAEGWHMYREQLFDCLMSSKDAEVINAIANYLNSAFKKRQLILAAL